MYQPRTSIVQIQFSPLIKKVLVETDKANAEVLLKEATSYIDRMSVKGIVHKNNAARKKARLTKYVNNL